ncbi:MAG: hypothetical protein K6T29_04935 [Peptococcaceae bacterium]|nr:hypothetical protein [Peptococcaceae bacterium]
MCEVAWQDFLPDVLALLKIALPAVFLGCLGGSLLRDTPVWHCLGRLTHPLARLGRLPPCCTPFLAVSFFNRYTANAMLAALKLEGSVGEKEVLYSCLAASFPSGVHFLAFYIAPALVSSLGWRLGAVYSFLYVLISLFVTLMGLGLGRRYLPPRDYEGAWPEQAGSLQAAFSRKKVAAALRAAAGQFCRLSLVFVPVVLLSSALLHTPAAARFLETVNPALSRLGLPAAAVLVVAAGVPSMMAGIGALGPMVREGLLTGPEAVVTLLITSILHGIYECWTGSLPANVAIFGGALGLRVSLAALLARTLVTLGVIVLVILFY